MTEKNEKLPDHSDFDDGSSHVDLSTRTITKIAQNLFEIYSNSGINISEWITCLTEYLSEHFMDMSPEDVLVHIKEKIIRVDKQINIDELHFEGQQQLIREVAEWLSAEKICEGMVEYELDIENGIKDGRYQEIYSIEDIIVIKDHEVFHGRKKGKATKSQKEEIKKNIKEHYVIKRSELLSHGTRVDVFEFLPRRLPMPIPRRDELIEGLMLQSPNNFMVVRIMRDSYKQELGNSVESSEKEAIEIFELASKYLVFTPKDQNIDSIQENTAVQAEEALGDKTVEIRSGINSFIPPLMIIKAKLTEDGEPEYLTIQKKVKARGEVSRNNLHFKKDVREFADFREKVKQFLAACKKFYKKTDHLPDTVGRGNVLYTCKGNINLVDINNITPEPDYKLLSLIMMLREIDNALKSGYFKEISGQLKSEYFNVLGEIIETFKTNERYRNFDLAKLQTIVEKIYCNPNDPVVYEFLKMTYMIDDKDEPIFMLAIDNLMRIEKEVLDAELEKGLITEEEHKKKFSEMGEESLYKIFTTSRGAWLNERSLNIDKLIENKNHGYDNWMSHFMGHLLEAIRTKSCAN